MGGWVGGWKDACRKLVSNCPKLAASQRPESSQDRSSPPSTHRDDDICDGLVGHLAVPKRLDVESTDLQHGGHVQQESCNQQ